MTTTEDARAAARYGADFLGFVFFEPSPRYVAPERVKRILGQAESAALPVGVFVNETVENIARICRTAGIRIVQLHGDEDARMIETLRSRNFHVFKSLAVHDADSFKAFEKLRPDRFLLDAVHPGFRGGSGKTFNWDLLDKRPRIVEQSIVAGGLGPENVARLLDRFVPWGIDLSSGVESRPGRKDPRKLETLFARVRACLAGRRS
jgi:phosphoribosylanthranilate isomerase